MYATADVRQLRPARGEEPARPKKRRDMSKEDDRKLIDRLDALCDRWKAGEKTRVARDKRGMRLFRGDDLLDGLTTGSKLSIDSQTPLSLFEQVTSDVLRGIPEPELEATNPDEDEAARVAQGAIRTNWRETRMLEKTQNAYILSGFTRQLAFYHYWRHEMHNGIGDVDKRLIPGHRLIFDDRHSYVQDMEFIGFEEEMSRAKLITLFPDKAEEIEIAGDSASDRVGNVSTDPLKPSNNNPTGASAVDRLVTQNSTLTPPFSPVTSITTASGKRGGKRDPLSENVKVRFLWTFDPTPVREKRPVLDPKTKRPQHQLVRDADGKPEMDDEGFEVMETPAGPQYVPKMSPKYEMLMEDVIVHKYKHRRHSAYIVQDSILLWDVSWEGPVPLSILRDRYPAYGFDAPGTALRLCSLNMSRNVLWTIIFQRLKKSLAGTWIASANSGLKRNTLVNDIGAVFMVQGDVNAAVKEFPVNPLDAAYFSLLDKLENEMTQLLGVTPMMRGQAVGRADSPQTYEQVADQSGGPTLARAKLVDYFIHDATVIDLWFMQNHYTHEHIVEFEEEDGFPGWTEASALMIRGKFAVRVDTGATLGRSKERDRQEATEGAQAGFYALPMLGRMGHFRNWRQGLKQKGAIMSKGPQYQWLLGAAGAPPATQALNNRQALGKRSHHKPGGK
jgi:hypothetical protein